MCDFLRGPRFRGLGSSASRADNMGPARMERFDGAASKAKGGRPSTASSPTAGATADADEDRERPPCELSPSLFRKRFNLLLS